VASERLQLVQARLRRQRRGTHYQHAEPGRFWHRCQEEILARDRRVSGKPTGLHEQVEIWRIGKRQEPVRAKIGRGAACPGDVLAAILTSAEAAQVTTIDAGWPSLHCIGSTSAVRCLAPRDACWRPRSRACVPSGERRSVQDLKPGTYWLAQRCDDRCRISYYRRKQLINLGRTTPARIAASHWARCSASNMTRIPLVDRSG
jgi:hypothetical protein